MVQVVEHGLLPVCVQVIVFEALRGKVRPMANVIEQFREILLEATPIMEGAQALLRQGDAAWIMALNDEVTVELHVDERLHKLVLCMPLGVVKDEQRTATYQALLVANGLWRETGGLRFGLDAPDGEIEQCLDLNLNDIAVQYLIEILQDFVDRGRVWREIIALHGGLNPEQVEQQHPDFNAGMLRI
ncbi:MAG: type III secretion system chaperone [Candidatus Competibacteraceae bacterium]